jgi:hypothetical protein
MDYVTGAVVADNDQILDVFLSSRGRMAWWL